MTVSNSLNQVFQSSAVIVPANKHGLLQRYAVVIAPYRMRHNHCDLTHSHSVGEFFLYVVHSYLRLSLHGEILKIWLAYITVMHFYAVTPCALGIIEGNISELNQLSGRVQIGWY